MSFKIQRIDREDFQVLSVSGYMGNGDCGTLQGELEQLFQQGHRLVIIDFAALTFVTSASLDRVAKQARWFEREGGEIRLCGLPASATRLLQLARLERTLNVAADLAAAVQAVPAARQLRRANPALPIGQKSSHGGVRRRRVPVMKPR